MQFAKALKMENFFWHFDFFWLVVFNEKLSWNEREISFQFSFWCIALHLIRPSTCFSEGAKKKTVCRSQVTIGSYKKFVHLLHILF